jgi:streptogramin lyase
MKKTTLLTTVIVSAFIVFSVEPSAAAGDKTEHEAKGTITTALVRYGENFPAVGSTLDAVWLHEMSIDGGNVIRGAGEAHDEVKSGDLATGLQTRSARQRDYFPQGSLKEEGTNTIAPQPDGTVSFTSETKITGGTGKFKGATGTVTFTGTVPSLTTQVAAFSYSGTLSY